MFINQISELESSLDVLDQPGKPEVLLQLLSYYQTKDLSKARFYANLIEKILIDDPSTINYLQQCQLLERLQSWYEFCGDIDLAYATLKRLHKLQLSRNKSTVRSASPYEVTSILPKIDKHLKAVLDTISSRICYIDQHLNYLYANKAYRDSVNHTDQTIVGKSAVDVIGEEAMGSIHYYIKRAFDGEVVGYRQEMDYKQGKKFMDTKIFPIKSEGSAQVCSCIVITEDITQLQKIKRELQNSREDLGEFAYAASHDLKGPIRSIVGFTQLLERHFEGNLTGEQTKWINLVVNSSKRLNTIIDDLEKYADLHRYLPKTEETDLNKSLHMAIQRLEDPIKDSEAIIHFQQLPTIKASTNAMATLFSHLLENAIKFSAPGRKPEITICYSEYLNSHRITFKDNGIGFNNEYKDKIFKLFKRLHTQEAIPGTGIGLASCEKIIVHMGGQIRAEAKEGIGSTIYITLPKNDSTKSLKI